MDAQAILNSLEVAGNLRQVPQCDADPQDIDLSSNDYLGLAQNADLRHRALDEICRLGLPLSASASRLLSAHQQQFSTTESLISDFYPGRSALLFNSGYHANTGIIPVLADRDTLVLADRLVHASIIDGILLSRARCIRFRHNDYEHLYELMRQHGPAHKQVLIVAESVYSMDGDRADIAALAIAKQMHPEAMLYVDEAHALGVEGPCGLGLCIDSETYDQVDVIMGTFGKALASVGAFAAIAPALRQLLVNKARSFIFSTALPPATVCASRIYFEAMTTMEAERQHLRRLASVIAPPLNAAPSHIMPLMVGDPKRAVALSQQLLARGVKALPIRTPTVPPGTDRLRFSLSAAITLPQAQTIAQIIRSL